MSTRLEIRSFRSVFALERRIYRIDTLRLNPSGIPLTGIGYALALIVVAVVAGAVPPTSWLDPVLPWYVRDLGLPISASFVLGSVRLDGRPFHLAGWSAVSHAAAAAARRSSRPARDARRWRPPAIVYVPDGSDPQFRRMRYRGPGAVLVLRSHRRIEGSRWSRADLVLRPLAERADRASSTELVGQAGIAEGAVHASVIELAAGARLEVWDR